MIKVEYDKEFKMWEASYLDEIGQLGHSFMTKKKEDSIFGLGMAMGRNPERYSRPLSQYLDKPAKI
jgi:hypothetical protein